MRNILQLFANPPRPLSSLPNINMLWAVLTVEELCRCGVTVFCLCPGSRSTPLAVAVSWNAKATSVVMHDERSAGFYCVGYARAKRKPAACIVTSGTAVANLLPAAVEASQQGLPMLLLTADRPFELRDNGSNQTIEQAGIFGRYVRWSRDLCCPSDQIPANVLLSDVDFAVHRASSSPRGPVHLNFQFRENLAPDGGPVRDNPPGNPISSTWSRACIASLNMAKWEHSALPHTLYPSSSSHVEVPAEVLSSMARARRGLVVVGNLFTAEDMATVGWVAAELCWPVWCDAQSGGRWDFGPFGMRGVSMMDQMLTNQRVSGALRPDFILQFGERLVSKRILSLISSCCYSDRCSYVVVSDAPGRQDPSAIVTHYLSCSPTDFGKQLSRWMQHNRIYPSDLLPLEKMSEHARTALWSSLSGYKDLEEPLIALRCSESLARGRALFVSSSMPIRDVDMFFHAALSRERPEIGCNRGASGIDGIVSSALGYAGGRGRPLTLLLGDTAALYDLSAIRHVPDCPHPVVLVIVNNGGCGIFRFLPIAQHEEMMEKFFINSHQIDFESLARSFGIDYMHAATAGWLLLPCC
ncbi:hypothetical protein GUITHDRAFT_72208 [Guillardia theta CCMP2712]|uniref:2-succinyl-5-enolpyruvyl-6-hydroxy-3-cyclohexene-1-carboxylic-acid synthase n=1 Tax=Guillardia theta (strain CCMP2712) TaxID=905079 RepID=L1J7F3_GUITC|nr:hypothetical protein GUITHDRAFT_72208 [Guillardia theta CCMP2712]EKX44468.1 hypothetical protein GUITHDRAFT_72208 [Guillardia theta CCMP2712]|eukprot:XP_005831448.1 hypothetical protein GUITHDRAFT_72208 [Guillardia theta CCMP2712]